MSRTSLREIVHLVASLLVLTIAFTYPDLIPQALLAAAFGVGIGFLLHELAHKFMAQRYSYVADYEASPMGLMMALGLSLATHGGFVFAAPGAVMIRGKRAYYNPLEDRYWDSHQAAKELAYISVSGAVVNLVLAVSFLIATFSVAPLVTGAHINVFLAAFNMIPFGPLDGAKVWQYNRSLWLTVMIPSILLFILFPL
jgi:Zn-dependent protease